MIERMLYLYAESPVHAGGADGAGVVDDPIQREITTKYPVIWGQSLKGALRSLASVHLKNDDVVRLFGTEVTSAADKTRGSITVGDAQIVAFPVPTVVNSFAWATSTLALSKLNRKLVQVDSSRLIQPFLSFKGRQFQPRLVRGRALKTPKKSSEFALLLLCHKIRRSPENLRRRGLISSQTMLSRIYQNLHSSIQR